MVGEIIYDTDVLSCFISINDVSVLKKLFDEVIIPPNVYMEMSKIPIFKNRVDKLIQEGFVKIEDFSVDNETYELYLSLKYGYEIGEGIGDGEAAAIALAVQKKGILASNNTDDVKLAVKKFNIKRIKTGDILVKAYNEKIIIENEANLLWEKMLKKDRYLTKNTFTEYLRENSRNKF